MGVTYGRLNPPEVLRQVGRRKRRQGKPGKGDIGIALRTLVIDEMGRLARIELVIRLASGNRQRLRQKGEQDGARLRRTSQRAGRCAGRGSGAGQLPYRFAFAVVSMWPFHDATPEGRQRSAHHDDQRHDEETEKGRHGP